MIFRFEISNLKLSKPAQFSPAAGGRLQIANCRLQIERIVRAAWWFLRQVSGDAAYENYLRHAGASTARADSCVCPHARGRAGAAMSPEEFYLDSLRRRYSGVSRCC
jgi:uncharacterized short protein YbdD (DUF466 family)